MDDRTGDSEPWDFYLQLVRDKHLEYLSRVTARAAERPLDPEVIAVVDCRFDA